MMSESDARTRILECAEALFAERGFRGARVDEIARRAGVNKALIYYYFKSKQQLLDHLIERFLAESRPLKADLLAQFAGRTGATPAASDDALDSIIGFLARRRSIIMIILNEGFHGESDATALLRYADNSFRDALAALPESASVQSPPTAETPAVSRLMFRSFFHLLLPLLGYTVLEDRWARYHGTVSRETRSWLAEIMRENLRAELAAVSGG